MAKKPIAVTLRKPSSAQPSEPVAREEDRDTFVVKGTKAEVREGYRSITLWLPEDLADRLAVHCRTVDRDTSALVSDIVQQYLDELARPKVEAAPPPPLPSPESPVALLRAWVREQLGRVVALRPSWLFA